MPQAFLLTFVAGYADSVSYLRFNAFAGMMTGNTVLLSIQLLEHHPLEALAYAALILGFFAGAAAAQLALHWGRQVWMLLTVEGLLLITCEAVRNPWGVAPLVLAMGIQASAANRFGNAQVATTFITGNLQRFAKGLVDAYGPKRDAEAVVAIYGVAWLGYVAGAGAGAAGFAFLAWPLLVPAAILPAVFLRRRQPV
jgi:uncharacterized membrane protein YoaK (UPF0700 family)